MFTMTPHAAFGYHTGPTPGGRGCCGERGVARSVEAAPRARTAVALVLLAVLYLYPAAIARALFGRLIPTSRHLRALVPDPGSLGIAIYALVMPILGLPDFLFAIVVFLVALDLISPETIPLATSPRSFSVAVWLFAHNLKEAIGIMTLGAL
jgi:hypothetical protein